MLRLSKHSESFFSNLLGCKTRFRASKKIRPETNSGEAVGKSTLTPAVLSSLLPPQSAE